MSESEATCRWCGGRIVAVEITGVVAWVHPHVPPMNGSIGNQWCPLPGDGARHRAMPAREIEP